MTGPDATLIVQTTEGDRTVELSRYLTPDETEIGQQEANAWIKSLRLARIDDRTLRERFTHRGQSLWWFTELYLHKRGTITAILWTISALEALCVREKPRAIRLLRGDRIARTLAPQVAGRHGIPYCGPGDTAGAARDRCRLIARELFYTGEALAARLRPRVDRPAPSKFPKVVAFVHSAFWQSGGASGRFEPERYIGSVLQALAERVGPDELDLVGVGPRTNFRGRRWWHRLWEFGGQERGVALRQVADFAGWRDIRPSFDLWRRRGRLERALNTSPDLRARAVFRGHDAWSIVRHELAGVVRLQWPWSARVMDEAGAALDRLRPDVVVTYAEAGGWGRAIALEARRRAIPVVGLQHGFIYRHWLNYLHEPDEMEPAAPGSPDRGFPRPDATLVFDEFAARHLIDAGRFPPAAVRVTGSPRLDAFIDAARAVTPEGIEQLRHSVGAGAGQQVVLIASKYLQIRAALRPLIEAIAGMPDVLAVIKCHPAETPAPYRRAAAAAPNIVVVGAGADLAALAAAARLVVTVNSTVAVDAMVLGVPSLVLGLPNNLSPFVAAGVMTGTTSAGEIAPAVRSLLYDEARRAELIRRGRDFMARFGIGSDGGATRRSVDAILAVMSERNLAAPDRPAVARDVEGSRGRADSGCLDARG